MLAAVVVAGVVSSSGGAGAPGGTTATGSVTTLAGAAPGTTAYEQVQTAATSLPVQKVALTRTLSSGVFGDDVKMVQERMTELGFNMGPPDGQFGPLTQQAVWAFEKLVMKVPRAEATGKVTPEMWDLMQDPLVIEPRRPTADRPPDSGDHVEIYIPEQVMIIFHQDVPALITHVSTGQQNPDGTPYQYCEDITVDSDSEGNLLPEPVTKPICGLAKTPPGVFQAYRKVEGTRDGPLGSMWDPTYINQGIAIHGANKVPLEPASHGCIRVSRYLGPIVQDMIDLRDFVYIWDGKKEPEAQTKKDRQMQWDWIDPTRTTTTSTSTTSTTVPATTTAPSTTVKTTTTPPPTTPPPTTVANTEPPVTDPPGG